MLGRMQHLAFSMQFRGHSTRLSPGVVTAQATAPSAALVTRVDESPTPIGVVSWTLLNDGWHAIRPRFGAEPRVEIRLFAAADLASELAPVLADVTR